MNYRDFRELRPIDDLLLALHLLIDVDRSHMRLMTRASDMPHYIEVLHCCDGYGRDLLTGSEFYPVSNSVSTELKQRLLVEGQSYWGYTDQNECVISGRGIDVYRMMSRDFMGEVHAYLAREHKEKEFLLLTTVPLRLHSMRYCRNIKDFYVAMDLPEQKFEVRRTRGALSLVHKET